MITATIVDDEQDCCEVLATLLEKYCPEVKIIDICHSAEEAIVSLKEHSPQILFLDVEMPYLNGFELLGKLENINFALIFTTSYDQYAIKAIRFSALEYLLKPIDCQELQVAVQKAMKKNAVLRFRSSLKCSWKRSNSLRFQLPGSQFQTLEGFQWSQASDIIRCEADGNYTHLFLKNKTKTTTTRNLKEMEEMLEDYSFIRVHNSYIVNINETERYIRGEGGYLVMSDGSSVNVSRSRKVLLK